MIGGQFPSAMARGQVLEPGKPWNGKTCTVLHRTFDGDWFVMLDELPDGWPWRSAWFGAGQVVPINSSAQA